MRAQRKSAGPTRLFVLLTDFGLSDWYVGVMKGVLTARAPGVPIVDLTHEISPGDVRAAAFVLENSWTWFAEGSIFLVVVDPGVGTARRAIAVRAGDRFFVGPDNGVLSPVLETSQARVHLIDTVALGVESVSNTFHGRDIFAPAAALLAEPGAFDRLGTEIDDAERIDRGHLVLSHNRIAGHVVYVDRFGNCITDISESALSDFRGSTPPSSLVVRTGEVVIRGVVSNYVEADAEPCALIGSSGRLEIAVGRGDASTHLGLEAGDVVEISLNETD